MKKMSMLGILLVSLPAFVFSGCTISPVYVMEKERVDQKMQEGNRGYLKGTPPPAEDRSGLKRSFIAIDIEMNKFNDEEGGSLKRKTYIKPARVSKQQSAPQKSAGDKQKKSASPATKKTDPYKNIK